MHRLIFILFLLVPFTYTAQSGGKVPSSGEIYGSVIDSTSNNPMEYVTIAIYKEKDSSLVTGSITNLKGKFSIPKIKPGNYYVLISFVGYQPRAIHNIEVSAEKMAVNVGQIKLDNSLKLKEVVIRGDIPTVSYEIDKKVVNVEDMTTTVGQSAAEVLQNTPSIQVDAEGNVTLRGSSSYQLLINGIPTAMDAADALQSIPASTIKEIEIVTNPSAREQAEGVGGLINIITKKNKLEGVSMLVNLSGGNFERYGGDMAVNYREEKHAVNLNLAYNKRNSPSDIFEERISDFGDYQTKVLSNGESSWKRGGMRLGGEWIFTPNSFHVFSLGTTYSNRLMTPYNNAVYEEYLGDSLVNTYENKYSGDITMNSLSNFLAYRYIIDKETKEYINFKAIYNYKSVNEISENNFLNEAGVKTGGNYATETGPSNVWRFDVDYLKTLKNKMVFEAGLQAQFGLSGDDRDNYTYDPVLGENVLEPLFSSDVAYTRNVHAAYGLIKGKKNKLGYQVGLRGEYTYRDIEATNIAGSTQEVNRIDLFPSAHFSYKLAETQELLFSYSRRINRPRSYYFEPFITWVSPYSVRTGNADLKPEYMSSIEARWIKQLTDKGSFSVDVYTKLLTNLINRIPSVYDTNIVIEAPTNAGNSTSIGMDPTLIYYVKDWWNVNFGASLYYYSVTSQIEDIETTNESFNWNLNWINTLTFAKDWKFQLIAQYRSKTATPLGYIEENYGVDVSLNKSFWNKKLAITLQASNILSTRQSVSYSTTSNLDVYSIRTPFAPMYMATISLKLNNYKKILSKKEELDDF